MGNDGIFYLFFRDDTSTMLKNEFKLTRIG